MTPVAMIIRMILTCNVLVAKIAVVKIVAQRSVIVLIFISMGIPSLEI